MFLVLKKKTALLVLFFLAVAIATISFGHSQAVFDPKIVETIIIDPGHGGSDPGGIGISGTSEKDINLAVSLLLKEKAEAYGFNVVMTRETDVSLHDPKASNKKRSDLQNRKEKTEKIPAAIFISIHMNKFEQSSVRGAQTFYAETGESKALSEAIQEQIKILDPQNKRFAMKTPKTVYLLQGTKRPSVLIEGGFLSNPSEEEKLQTKEYQDKLANAILDGITVFLGKSESQ